ncbi:MAG: transketolase, partial [Phycisphaerae bacterium]
RKMCVGIKGLEGSAHGHDVIKVSVAKEYLTARGLTAAVDYLNNVKKGPSGPTYEGSCTKSNGKNRDLFGKILNEILDGIPAEKRVSTVRVFDSDLEGSCGLNHVRASHP